MFINFFVSFNGLYCTESSPVLTAKIKWLDNLSELLANEELKEKLPVEILEILQKHYDNPGWWDDE